jgi:hypothetical protein
MTKLNKGGAVAVTARMLAWKQPFIQRVRNSSLVERPCIDNERASSHVPKPWIVALSNSGRRAFCSAEKGHGVSYPGACRKANVGISNDKGSEKLPHRKTKGSLINVNRIRVSRDLRG